MYVLKISKISQECKGQWRLVKLIYDPFTKNNYQNSYEKHNFLLKLGETLFIVHYHITETLQTSKYSQYFPYFPLPL